MVRFERRFASAKRYLGESDFELFEPTLKALSVLLLLFAVFHASQLANFTLSIDDEYAAFRENPVVWVSQGRWTTYLFERFVLSQPVVPFLPIALFGLCCSAGYLLFLRAIGEHHPSASSLAFFPLFAAFPTWAFLTAFQANTPSAGIGLLLSCYCAFLYRKTRDRAADTDSPMGAVSRLAALGLIGATAIGCYQSYLLFLATALSASILAMGLAGKPARALLKDGFAAVAILAISLLLYGLIQKLFLVVLQGNVAYIQDFVRLDDLFDRPDRVILKLLKQMRSVYLGGESTYGYSAPVMAVFLVLAVACIVNHARQIAPHRGGVIAGLAIFALLIAPFGMNVLSGGTMPLRSLVAAPLAFTSIGILGFKYAPRWVSRISLVALLLVCFAFFKTLSGFNAARDLVQIHDRLLAASLAERIARVAGPSDPGKPLLFDVFGSQPFRSPYPKNENSTIGASFFEWDGGNPHRIAAYMRLIGLPVLRVVAPERRAKLLDDFVLMPAWPASGSVKAAADGTILVKLSDVPNPIYRQLLVGPDPSGDGDSEPFYRLSAAAEGSWSTYDAKSQRTGDGILLDTKNDPQFMFDTSALQKVETCSRIELRTRLKIERPTQVWVFYKIPGQTDYRGDTSAVTEISPAPNGGFVDVSLQLISGNGFVDPFRLDPVEGGQRVTIGEIALFCRHMRPR